MPNPGAPILEVLAVSIRAPKRGDDSRPNDFLIRDGRLELVSGQICSIEGDNKSGKSTLIGALAGAYVQSKRKHRFRIWKQHQTASTSYPTPDDSLFISMSLRFNGDLLLGLDVPTALRYGIVAVYQDDDLIPSMTVAEQFSLRHARQPIARVLGRETGRFVDKALVILPEEVSVQRFVEQKLLPSLPGTMDEKQVLERARELLSLLGGSKANFADIINQFPKELSGSGKAIARLAQALLHENISVLLLDEVFRGVQADVWPEIIRNVRRLCVERNIAVQLLPMWRMS